MREELKDRINATCYKNAVLKYQGKLYQVDRYKLTWDRLAVIATPKSIILQIDKVEGFLDEVELMSHTPVVANKTDIDLDDFSAYNKLNQGLLRAFETVQNDEDFIPKAKQMCNIAREIVNLEKTKLEILKMSK